MPVMGKQKGQEFVNEIKWFIKYFDTFEALAIMNMNTEESTQSFDWVYYVLGIIAGILIAASVTGSVLSSIAGGIVGLIISALFLNKIVKGRTY